MKKEKLHIIKIGGNVIDHPEKLEQFLTDFAAIKGKKILIHGGGKLATDLAEKMQIPQQMHHGRRITDAETLKLVTMVYAGFINKNVVAHLQSKKCEAIGVSGADFNLIKTEKRLIKEIDFGFVGDIFEGSIHVENIIYLLEKTVPIFSAITHDGTGQLLNTNADTLASEIAIAMSKNYETELYFCFEKKGVLSNQKDENSVISLINKEIFEDLKSKDIINKGMLPKLENAFLAVEKGVKSVHILQENAILKVIKYGTNDGTKIQ